METRTRIDGTETARCSYCRRWFELDDLYINKDGRQVCYKCDGEMDKEYGDKR
jgi:hypothetical protein